MLRGRIEVKARRRSRSATWGLLVLAASTSSMHAPNALGADAALPIRWDLALINGLEVSAVSLGNRDRIRVVTLGPSGCTPRSARLSTRNIESGSEELADVRIQGRTVQFEVESFDRPTAVLILECLERQAQDPGAPRTFVLSLDPGKSK